jgi:hypothetical protein
MKQYKFITITFLLLCILNVSAQQKLEKISQSVQANKDVVIDLNTSYTNIEIDTWNKDVVEVEAYIESSELTKEELQEALDNWDVQIEGSGQNIVEILLLVLKVNFRSHGILILHRMKHLRHYMICNLI